MKRALLNLMVSAWLFVIIIFSIFHIYSAINHAISIGNGLFFLFIGLVSVEVYIFLQFILVNFSLLNFHTEEIPKSQNYQSSFEHPDVDVFIPIKNGKPELLEKTLEAVKELEYSQDKVHIYVGDDTNNDRLKAEIEQVCQKFQCNYIYSGVQKQFKAGMLNILLSKSSSPIILMLDYDQIPVKSLLKDTLAELYANERSEDIAFVQCAKRFVDLNSIGKKFSSLLYLQYFEVAQKSKNKRGTVLFAGSTAIFKREVLQTIGGFTTDSLTEDTDTSIVLMTEGYRGIYLSKVGSFGQVPCTYKDQLSQISRWALGASQTFRLRFWKILKSRHLSLGQKSDLLATTGITIGFPIIFLYGLLLTSLIPLGINTPRLVVGHLFSFPISSYIGIPIIGIVTYIIILSEAFTVVENEPNLKQVYKWRHLPIMAIIGLSTTILILFTGIYGLLNIESPRSKKARWSRNYHVFRNSIIYFVLGLAVITIAIKGLYEELMNATYALWQGVALLVPLPVSLWLSFTEKCK